MIPSDVDIKLRALIAEREYEVCNALRQRVSRCAAVPAHLDAEVTEWRTEADIHREALVQMLESRVAVNAVISEADSAYLVSVYRQQLTVLIGAQVTVALARPGAADAWARQLWGTLRARWKAEQTRRPAVPIDMTPPPVEPAWKHTGPRTPEEREAWTTGRRRQITFGLGHVAGTVSLKEE